MTQRRRSAADIIQERRRAKQPKKSPGPADGPPGVGEPTPEETRDARRREAEVNANFRPGDAAEPKPEAIPGQVDPRPAAGWRWRPMSSADLAASDHRPDWLVSQLLVAGQPCVMGGPQKSLKTSLAVDLLVSLTSGTPHLGRFAVPRARRAAILSGESGAWTLRETALRVCGARGVDLASLSLVWQMDLPRLSAAGDLDELARGLADDGVEVVAIDPLYLCLLAGQAGAQASSLYDMGPLLMRAGRACLDAVATPVLLHHATRPASRTREPLELTDLAYSGIAEYARQWLLVSRRETFEPGQAHKLWLSAGGSCGQGGLWAVDVDEGRLLDDFSGRRWDVEVRSAGEERAGQQTAAARARDETRLRVEADQDRRLLDAIDAMDRTGQGVGLRQARESIGMSGDVANAAASRLIDRGILEDVSGYCTVDEQGRRHPARGVGRCVGD